jgi:hypothetical protein
MLLLPREDTARARKARTSDVAGTDVNVALLHPSKMPSYLRVKIRS